MQLSRFCVAVLLALVGVMVQPVSAHATAIAPDTVDHNASSVTFEKARVLEVLSQSKKQIPGTDTISSYQTIRVQLTDGAASGKILTVDNDYLMLKAGDSFYFMHTVDPSEGIDTYAVSEPYRLPVLGVLLGLFLLCVVVFGGSQGVRGLLALVGSIFFIAGVLLPGILQGYSPILVSVGVASVIIVFGSYITHGFTKTTSVAVVGMLLTVGVTGALSYVVIGASKLSGFANEGAVYLNFATRGSIDFVGLLLGAMIIGFLGVLYDAAIGQAIAVEELCMTGALTRAQLYARGLRIGREHIGALINTLAIAYVGAALPLMLLFKTSKLDPWLTINQEVFATEIVRILVGSIGLILAVPITTAIAVYVLTRWPPATPSEHTHGHHH